MKKKALYAYAGLLLLSVCSYVLPHRAFTFVLPAYLTLMPFLLGGRIHFSLSARHFRVGLLVSALVLLPLSLAFADFRIIRAITLQTLAMQLFAVSLPEEIFFRGFLQDVLGNDLRGVIAVSVLFSVAHLPAMLFGGDVFALMTFFPSLVMGLLYMKTSNILPSTVFHFLSNVVFSAFVI
jgi:membrane protease YdiL (CAAX protease family)